MPIVNPWKWRFLNYYEFIYLVNTDVDNSRQRTNGRNNDNDNINDVNKVITCSVGK